MGMNVKVLARTGPFFLSALAIVILALRNVSSYLYLLVVVSSQVSCDDEQIVTTDEEEKKKNTVLRQVLQWQTVPTESISEVGKK